jgi:hypothetical protein
VRKFSTEEWIGIACVVIFALFLLYVMTGCAAKQAKHTEIIWSKGECLLIVDSVSATEAENIAGGFRFKECEIEVEKIMGKSKE